MEREILDYVLVPVGLVVMTFYHVWLLHQLLHHPTRTVIGINSINRRFWVQAMMEDVSKNGVLAVQTLRNNIMASTLLASTAIMLSSMIAVLMTSSGKMERSNAFIFGDESALGFNIKFFSILVCFLVAFLFNVQSIRYYSHASILINVPYSKMMSSSSSSSSSSLDNGDQSHCVITAEYVWTTVNRGSYFWSLGLRAFYFSFPLFLWIFGPIPMFLCCLVLVFLLYFLDVTLDVGWIGISAPAPAPGEEVLRCAIDEESN
ncbi:hypothetical protein M9H77_26265 [Catharanthus roseus]|uniref:Uncharacterized protein n=1 Tax=Catharanthus roseus TaxID=4058 RepID=A0ACC0AAJ5_CATRO|nr:hypothetical protein M9H77_26265 [Catharanthus roseus]